MYIRQNYDFFRRHPLPKYQSHILYYNKDLITFLVNLMITFVYRTKITMSQYQADYNVLIVTWRSMWEKSLSKQYSFWYNFKCQLIQVSTLNNICK